MRNIELFNTTFFDLPKKNYDVPYLDYISSNLEEYLKRINKFEGEIKDVIEKNRENLEILCSCILNSTKLYLEGKTFNAYNNLSKGLDKVKDSLFFPNENRIMLMGNSRRNFYKIRESYIKIKNRRDIFHIPFERKHLVSTNRYSIPGVPCVYLGNSIQTCWKELRSPKIKYLYATRYEVDLNTINLLDISMTNKEIFNLNKALIEKGMDRKYVFLEQAILTWPLAFACTIQTKYPFANFKEEYIIPQMLMQWCKTTLDIDGIKYLSTIEGNEKYKNLRPHSISIAIPIKSINYKGYCPEITKLFQCTEPINIFSLKHLRKKELSEAEMKLWLEKDNGSVPNYVLRSMIAKKHKFTFFDRVEVELNKLATEIPIS
ncbi:RES domain-containing protein [Labilibaculum sp. A4]|uniref:RES domain-containing protein n=1 Tax=Labilibaculum euxinus TaxID=2686357 RepID=UPI000F62875D|nr:RES domain-containing protein [Labilibaculum euxinus]MDQ1772333.1 RES domain-containing protein [Labilibaculum euxinus]MWN77969.1 RES domain-containing protein [Labilibaculum euxinus]